ncbi:hypothetical protein E2C01_047091 [Portunus trituberculatus]|uniref:Uncharacterized protein n=1 Tax=Portunus trituberculatus TaxID=210409 RepID=A0A5B7G7M0_PORTR|nr:hypothetical protein [Portunus trituberculatus]
MDGMFSTASVTVASFPQLVVSLIIILCIALIVLVFFDWRRFSTQASCDTSHADGKVPLPSTTFKREYLEFISFLFVELKYHRLRQVNDYKYLKAWVSVFKKGCLCYDRIERLAQAKQFIQGWKEGMKKGRRTGFKHGYHKGLLDGYTKGNKINYRKGRMDGLKAGDKDGYIKGYNEGYSAGNTEGCITDYRRERTRVLGKRIMKRPSF